jgi:hypothetical protein
MNTNVLAFDRCHQSIEPATRPIVGLPGRLATFHSQGARRIRKPPKTATTPLLVFAGSDHTPPRVLPHNPADPTQTRSTVDSRMI